MKMIRQLCSRSSSVTAAMEKPSRTTEKTTILSIETEYKAYAAPLFRLKWWTWVDRESLTWLVVMLTVTKRSSYA